MYGFSRGRLMSRKKQAHSPTVIDLFCGAGGLSEGFRQAGFRVLVGNDADKFAGMTYTATHHGAVFLPGQIQSLSAMDFLRTAKLRRGELDCLIGGPPCQAFSVYNHQRGLHDDRSNLFREYLRIVDGLLPKWVVMENVTGITSAGGGLAMREIVNGLSELGYNVETKILRAEQYGVPQERRRIFFIGNRLRAPVIWPEATHGPGLKPFVTVWEAIGDLPKLSNGEAPVGAQAYRYDPMSDFQRYVREQSNTVENHAAPRLANVNLERMKYIPEGGSWRDLPNRLLPTGMKLARRCDHTKRYGRLKKDGLASTILTKCDLHWGAYIHPEQDRVLTVREAARLQAFPDWFVFNGPKTEQYIQVGNAVPPLLGKHIAQSVLSAQPFGRKRAVIGPMDLRAKELHFAL